ncbi:MAG: hypothetical protein HC888_15825 [Candidatus Competibacteraceae bacterium]|nr:hypothetical protein [Candidatus Competibacteraceae bacterium]
MLVVFNEYDEYETRFGAEVVVDAVNRVRPDSATLLVLPQLSHSFYRFPTRNHALAFRREDAINAGEMAAAQIMEAMAQRFGASR